MSEIEKEVGEADRERIGFFPPLYLQRDQKIIEILKEDTSNGKIIDLGCAECRLLRKLKEIEHAELIIGIDLERNLLEDNTDYLKPLAWNSLFPRSRPLTIKLFHGNLLESDTRTVGCDAVILTEVVEHLVNEDLLKLPKALFAYLCPQVCIVTTPNSEYNIVFGSPQGTFRHYDHKFEWTRKQFSDWCSDIVDKFPYSVEFDGVGDPPSTHPDVGSCTQIAIFRRLINAPEKENLDIPQSLNPYKLMAEIEYPFEDPATTNKKKLLTKIYSLLENEANLFSRNSEEVSYVQDNLPNEDNSWESGNYLCIPLSKFMNNITIQDHFGVDERLRKFLNENGFELHGDKFVKYQLQASSSEEDDF